MITCPVCRKFVRHISTVVNGLDEIVSVKAICKTHGEVDADYETYEEVIGGEKT